jgi:hypothetical protein
MFIASVYVYRRNRHENFLMINESNDYNNNNNNMSKSTETEMQNSNYQIVKD